MKSKKIESMKREDLLILQIKVKAEIRKRRLQRVMQISHTTSINPVVKQMVLKLETIFAKQQSLNIDIEDLLEDVEIMLNIEDEAEV